MNTQNQPDKVSAPAQNKEPVGSPAQPRPHFTESANKGQGQSLNNHNPKSGYWAHSANSSQHRHDLIDHLEGVATRASSYATAFGPGFGASAKELAYYLGLWHDLGKFNPAFQAYLQECEESQRPAGSNPVPNRHPRHSRGPDHKAAGTLLARQTGLGIFALAIQGHHGGLRAARDLAQWLTERSADPATAAAVDIASRLMPALKPTGKITLPARINTDKLVGEFFLRMLFSALVDADFLDTEAHFNQWRTNTRKSASAIGNKAAPSLDALWSRFEKDQARLEATAGSAHVADPEGPVTVNALRQEMYRACLSAADNSPGFFRLSIPTGGGKTRSALAFALRHALKHNLARVIVAVPFTTITEQTAQVYRAIFEGVSDGPGAGMAVYTDHAGEGSATNEGQLEVEGEGGEAAGEETQPIVLEHHSAYTEKSESAGGDFHPNAVWNRLAAENWDAPVIVTTTVQLFESLFSNQTSRCRKLHRLAGSVIILDEAQSLPAYLLSPILSGLKELVVNYGASVVLSTATQPAFDAHPALAGLKATEIVPDSPRFFTALKRVEYEWRVDTPLSWEEVAELVRGEKSALAIVNTKKDALSLLKALDDPQALYLSTALCAAHRRRVVAEVKARLEAGLPCKLIATQVVEAGVDIDFPLVLRALAPLDSMAQAAGRCNREGRLVGLGRVIIFHPKEGGMPPGNYRVGASVSRTLYGAGYRDLSDPQALAEYFRYFYTQVNVDRQDIQKARADFDYPLVAEQFKMIEEESESVVVSFGSVQARAWVTRALAELEAGTPRARDLLRHLQPYTVAVRVSQAHRYTDQNLIREVLPGLGQWLGAYDDVTGLAINGVAPEYFIS